MVRPPNLEDVEEDVHSLGYGEPSADSQLQDDFLSSIN